MAHESSPDIGARLTALAEAVVDGRAVDWISLESSSDARDLALIAELRTIAEISRVHALSGSADPSLSDRDGPRTDPAALVGTRWGSLQIHEHLGSGRFGDVYRAFDPALDRDVALKLLRHHTPNEALVVQEGRLMARVRHPNVVTIYGAQRIDGQTGLWMEFIRGRTLHAELRDDGPFSGRELLRVGVELARALAAVHEAGLVHRDVKAQNVLRGEDGRIVLGDFGTGREFDERAPDGQIAGTPVYLAPEVLKGEAATPQSDLYSLGALMFFLATGRHRIQGRSVRELRAAHASGTALRLQDLRPELPGSMADVLHRALEPDPRRRFSDAAAMEVACAAAASLPAELATAASHHVTGARRFVLRLAAPPAVLLALGTFAYAWFGLAPVPSPGDRVAAVPAPAVTSTLALAEVPRAMVTPVPGIVSGTAISGRAPVPEVTAAEGSPRTGISIVAIEPEFSQSHKIHAPSSNPRIVTCNVRGRQAIAICDLVSSTVRELRVPGLNETGGVPRLSPDLARVAYVWSTGGTRSLRVIRADGSGDREILAPADGFTIDTVQWLDNGRLLVLEFQGEGGAPTRARRRVVSPDGGEAQTIWQGDPAAAGTVSSDGRSIALARDGKGAREMVIVDIASGRETIILSGDTNDADPFWAPGNGALLFRSDRNGVRGLYMVGLVNGARGGEPRLVHATNDGVFTPIGFAADGTLFIERMNRWYTAFRASIDLDAAVAGTPRTLDRRTSTEETPGVSLSPDGSRIAYIAGTFGDRTRPDSRVVILDRLGRVTREIPLAGTPHRKSRVRWSPDGARVAVNSNIDRRSAIEINYVDGDSAEVLQIDRVWDLKWDPRGDGIYYAAGQQVRRYDLLTKKTSTAYDSVVLFKEQIVAKALPGGFIGHLQMPSLQTTATFDVSPSDGSLLLPLGSVVRIVRPDGRFIDRPGAGSEVTAVAWTPDGSRILVSGIGENRFRAALAIMGAEEGAPVPISIDGQPITDLSLSADGREIFFAAGNDVPGYVMLRSFLP